MDIVTTLTDGKFTIDPDPALVSRGTNVRWIVRSPFLDAVSVRWIIRFERSPFESKEVYVQTHALPADERTQIAGPLGDRIAQFEDVYFAHRGATPVLRALESGDYKYEVAVYDAI